jgi:hypothetical protein
LHLNTNMDAPIRRLPQRAKKQEAHFSWAEYKTTNW